MIIYEKKKKEEKREKKKKKPLLVVVVVVRRIICFSFLVYHPNCLLFIWMVLTSCHYTVGFWLLYAPNNTILAVFRIYWFWFYKSAVNKRKQFWWCWSKTKDTCIAWAYDEIDIECQLLVWLWLPGLWKSYSSLKDLKSYLLIMHAAPAVECDFWKLFNFFPLKKELQAIANGLLSFLFRLRFRMWCCDFKATRIVVGKYMRFVFYFLFLF